MKLYHCPQTRSLRPLWLLEELGLDYQLETIDVFSGAGQQPDYLAIHPLGAVPALELDGQVIIEAAAICTFLTERFADKKLAPAIDDPARGLYHQWMYFVPGTMEPPLIDILRHSKMLSKELRIPGVINLARQQFAKIAEFLNQTVTDRSFLVGDHFTTADIMLATTLQWLPDLVEPFPALKAYGERMTERPAYQKALTL